MKKGTIILLITCLYFNCNKKNVEGDLSGKEYIRGRLFLYDTITQNLIASPLANKTINIAYADSPDTLNYLFSIKTDDQGYFIFQNLTKNKKYRVYYEEKINDIYYTGLALSYAPIDTLKVDATLSYKKQNGIYYSIRDSLGGAIKGVKVCIFSNVTTYNTGSCDASNYSLTTDEFGHAYKFNLIQGNYYVQASIKINNLNFSLKDTISIRDSIVSKELVLKQNKVNGFHYTILDSSGFRIGGATLCIFTSQVLFNKDTCDGSNFQVVSDINGIATRTDLQPGRYLVYGNIQQGNTIYYAKDTINIGNTILNDTLIFRIK
jgi:hypothetical protein